MASSPNSETLMVRLLLGLENIHIQGCPGYCHTIDKGNIKVPFMVLIQDGSLEHVAHVKKVFSEKKSDLTTLSL